MALPKEPRQKMINMMYLVLTALLALNVSVEIINAFVVVDNSLIRSNTLLSASSNNIYSSFSDMLTDPKTQEKASIWKPKADKARALSQKMSDLIDDYKKQLKKQADFNPKDSSFKKEDIDAATRLFDTKGEGEKLYKELESTKMKS